MRNVLVLVAFTGFWAGIFPSLFWCVARFIEPEWAGDFLTFPYRFWRDLWIGAFGRSQP